VRLLAALTVATGVVFAAGCATAARGSARPAAGAPAAPPAEQTAAPATAPGPEQAVKTSAPRTIEQQDPQLGAALKELAVLPTPERLRQVAERYRTLGILDAAFEHYRRATVLDARDGAAYEGLARVWRDWGFPDIALSAAHRAVFIAPDSASVHNTLGTVLQALGQFENAAAEYEQASRLDPRAAYAVSNLCYLSFLDGDMDEAAMSLGAVTGYQPDVSWASAMVRRRATPWCPGTGRSCILVRVSNDCRVKETISVVNGSAAPEDAVTTGLFRSSSDLQWLIMN